MNIALLVVEEAYKKVNCFVLPATEIRFKAVIKTILLTQ